MTKEQREEIKHCILFYEKHGYDWSDVIEYLVLRGNRNLDRYVIRTRIGVGYGRPRGCSPKKKL